MAFDGAPLLLVLILEEVERRQEHRDLNRRLRDTSDPFSLPEETFRQFYRLNKESCRDLFLELEPHFRNATRTTAIPNIVKMFTALNFYAHGSYQKAVGKDFHSAQSQSSVSRCIKEVSTIICNIGHRYIKFPRNQEEMLRIKNGFFQKFNFSGVVGTIDCTHIAIVPPPAVHPVHPGLAFINRKNYHSINCQIICDSDLKILAINARYPGSVHDSAIWMVCNIRGFLENNWRNGDTTTWLLGDSGYPLQPFLLTPIVGADPVTPEGRYTAIHCRTRNTIERCNGVLKAYFRCLRKDRVLHYDPEVAGRIINCCAVLHNILVDRRIHDLDLVIDDNDKNMNQNEHNQDGNIDLLQEGRNVRNQYIRNHCQ